MTTTSGSRSLLAVSIFRPLPLTCFFNVKAFGASDLKAGLLADLALLENVALQIAPDILHGLKDHLAFHVLIARNRGASASHPFQDLALER